MKKVSKIILSIAVIAVVAWGVVFLTSRIATPNSATNTAASKQEIKLGFMLPLTGQFGAIGEGIKNAGMMAVADYKAAHPNTEVSVVNEDDQFDTKKGITAYTKLTTLDKVAGIMMISTPVIDAIHEKMNADGLPIVSIGLQNDGIGPDNIFQTTLAPIAPIEYLAKNVDPKNYNKVAVVYNNKLAATKNFYDAFVKNYTKQHTDYVVTDAQSAKLAATEIVASGANAVVILEDAIGGPFVTKNLKLFDTKNSLTYYYDLQLATGWSEYAKILGDTNQLNGAYTLNLKGGDTTDFVKKYKATYNTDPPPFAEYGYDSAMILLNGYDVSPKKWIASIQSISYVGPSGKMTFDNDGVRIQDIQMTTVQNGSIVK